MTSYTGLFDLAKKVAVVTGGAGFLGKHFCRGLAEAGASVVVVDITATEVSAIVAEINEHRINRIGTGARNESYIEIWHLFLSLKLS